jgi:ABC-type proline/glycine betaine transport system permease subunit
MNQDQVASIARWIGTIGAGYLVTKGYASDSDTQMVVGAIPGLISLGWSMWHHAGETKAALVAKEL